MALSVGLVALLALGALISAVMEAMGKCPSFLSPLLLSVAILVSVFPK